LKTAKELSEPGDDSNRSCLFCKWAKNLTEFRKTELKSRWIMQSRHFFVVLDRYPKVTGHTLVISKQHYDDITQIDKKVARNLGYILAKTSKQLKKNLHAGKV
jgi:diadenosine tetraphosphate (Ap4A) HIT family hydrolase